MRRPLTPPSGSVRGHTRSARIGSVSNTKRTTLDLLVPRLRVRVQHAWWARMVKLVGTKAMVEGKSKGRDDDGGMGMLRRRSRSSGDAWRTLSNQFLSSEWLRTATKDVNSKKISRASIL